MHTFVDEGNYRELQSRRTYEASMERRIHLFLVPGFLAPALPKHLQSLRTASCSSAAFPWRLYHWKQKNTQTTSRCRPPRVSKKFSQACSWRSTSHFQGRIKIVLGLFYMQMRRVDSINSTSVTNVSVDSLPISSLRRRALDTLPAAKWKRNAFSCWLCVIISAALPIIISSFPRVQGSFNKIFPSRSPPMASSSSSWQHCLDPEGLSSPCWLFHP